MTTRVERVDVDFAPPPRQRIGLFTPGNGLPRLERRDSEGNTTSLIDRIGGGIGYEALDPSLTLATSSFDPCDAATVAEGEGALLEWNTWGIQIGEECSTLNAADGTVAAMERRAEARLNAQTSYLGEYTFWTGEVGGTQFDAIAPTAWNNIALTNHDAMTDLTPVDGEAGPVEAFGLIEEYLSDTLRGLRGVIHVAPQLLPYLAFYGIGQRDGFQIGASLSDHIVIAGSGYQGTGDDNVAVPDNRTWIYATSMVRVGMSDIETVSDYTREDNTAHAVSRRSVLAEWDEVAHAGVYVCLTDPGPTCAAEGS